MVELPVGVNASTEVTEAIEVSSNFAPGAFDASSSKINPIPITEANITAPPSTAQFSPVNFPADPATSGTGALSPDETLAQSASSLAESASALEPLNFDFSKSSIHFMIIGFLQNHFPSFKVKTGNNPLFGP